jgi:hypothetical protein
MSLELERTRSLLAASEAFTASLSEQLTATKAREADLRSERECARVVFFVFDPPFLSRPKLFAYALTHPKFCAKTDTGRGGGGGTDNIVVAAAASLRRELSRERDQRLAVDTAGEAMRSEGATLRGEMARTAERLGRARADALRARTAEGEALAAAERERTRAEELAVRIAWAEERARDAERACVMSNMFFFFCVILWFGQNKFVFPFIGFGFSFGL